VRQAVYRQLFAILRGPAAAADAAHLTPSDRRAIVEIVRDTVPGLPAELPQ
jgi:hypothetical protein